MDDGDEDATNVSSPEEEEPSPRPPPPRRAFSDGKAVRRLYRELGRGNLFSDPTTIVTARSSDGGSGGGAAAAVPRRSEIEYWANPAKALKVVHIASLDGQGELRKYFILGEKPTFPYHLVTIRRSLRSADTSAGGEAGDPAPGGLTYWALDAPANTVAPSRTVHYPESAARLVSYYISSAYTAWDIDRDLPAQLIVWDHTAGDLYPDDEFADTTTYQKLEFRYGAQSCLIDLCAATSAPNDPQVCFAGLPGDQQGVAVRALLPGTLLFYEPFGGAPTADTPSWSTAPETPALPHAQLHNPRVTVVDLCDIAARHLKAVLKRGTPEFSRCHSAFLGVRRPARFAPGERQRAARACTVAFGAAEARSRMYHLFVVELDPAARRHRVRAAKALGGGAVFAWEGLGAWGDAELFERAVERLLGRGSGGAGGGHVCGGECEEWGAGAVRVLCRLSGKGPVRVVKMVENGVALVGWGALARR